MMINLAAPILPGHALGGILLGSYVAEHLPDLEKQGYTVRLTIHHNPGIQLHSYQVGEGVLTLNADEAGRIVSLSCRQPYAGTYQQKLWPGMRVEQVRAATGRQLLTHGALVADGELGLYFLLPPPFDEADYSQQLPAALVLETLYVAPNNWRGY